jgi:transcriptional regulator with XRE-family HTH domain
MARGARVKPERLSEKLLQIRLALGLSQSEMLRRLGFEDAMDYRRISEFERGTTEPHLSVLLEYARAAGVHMEDIVDDELDLPERLPGNVRYKGIKRKSASSRRTKS